MENVDILIVGGGAAGIAAAKAAHAAGSRSILIAEHKAALGGILLQCAHRGFGDGKDGPQYVSELLEDFPKGVELALETAVLSVSQKKIALLSGRAYGEREVSFSQLILAEGCRETPLGALPIAGTRPAGVYTAGQMQELMNIYGRIPEGPVVILGSGDLGLVMAGHLLSAGIDTTIIEQKESCGGMERNRQALKGLPLKLILNSTILEIYGEKDIEGCIISDGSRIPCKTLLIATGLIPERELVFGLEDSDWLEFCGNCNRVHPMVEGVVKEGKESGFNAFKRLYNRS